ncbi:disulfide bond formation protein B [Candidatus Micrarchaeota archaeon]|nr:disulfide bond formation protein B [Candidatus Micrarchaeota archaeon]
MQLKSEGLALALIVSMCATLGSLSFQFVLGWEPCELCWFQRIFMYPLLIIGGVALYYKRSDVFVYVLPLSLIGGIISVYHYGVQFFDLASVCSVLDGPSKCALKLFAPFGYMTIPMMALTAFILNIVLIYIAESNNKSKNRI